MRAHMLNHQPKARAAQPPWDPLESTRANSDAPASDAAARFGFMGRYARIAVFLLIAVFVLPQVLIALLVIVFGGGFPAAGHLALVMVLLISLYLIGLKGFRRAIKASTRRFRAPAIRAPVMAAGEALGLDARGPISLMRLGLLRTRLGDIYHALGLPDETRGDIAGEAPDEFRGVLPIGSEFWCLMKTSEMPLASVPESFRGGRASTAQVNVTMLAIVLAFPLTRRRDFRLEVLHRVMQVMFARVALTIDTGSTAFNNRFLVAAHGLADEIDVHRAVTPALQSTLLDLAERFWLVNLVVEDDTAFVSAMDFHTAEGAQGSSERWIEVALGEAMAGTARIKSYLD